MYRVAEELAREYGAGEVESVCSEDQTEKNLAFAVSQGFISDRKRFQMDLDLSTWDNASVDFHIQRRGMLGVAAASFIQTPDEKATGCYIPYTGVLREYRGHGLARAVKLRAIKVAHEQGYPFVWTHNDVDNPAITSITVS